MADGKLRLQIVTALDNAGIKATKEQIESLEKSLSKVNRQGGMPELNKGFGELGGTVGKILKGLGGIGGKIARAIPLVSKLAAAFTVGYEAGKMLWDKFGEKVMGYKAQMDEIKNANKEHKKEIEETAKAYEKMKSAQDDASAAARQNIDDQAAKIDKMRQAWMKAYKAKSEYLNADQDIEIQQLERKRFDDVYALSEDGDFAGIEQLNLHYDMWRKELEAKKSIQQFDRETLAMSKQLEDSEEKRMLLSDKQFEANKRVRDLEKRQKWIDNHAPDGKYDSMTAENQKALREAKRQAKMADTALEAFDLEMEAQTTELDTRRKSRAILASQNQMELSKAAYNIDSWQQANGNPLNLDYTDKFKESLVNNYFLSYDDLEKAVSNGIQQGLAPMMEMK